MLSKPSVSYLLTETLALDWCALGNLAFLLVYSFTDALFFYDSHAFLCTGNITTFGLGCILIFIFLWKVRDSLLFCPMYIRLNNNASPSHVNTE